MSLEQLGANNFTCLAQLVMFLTIRKEYLYVKTKWELLGALGSSDGNKWHLSSLYLLDLETFTFNS